YGQQAQSLVGGGAYFLDEPPLVDLLDRVPVEAEVSGDLLDGQKAGELGHGALEADRGAPVGGEKLMLLVTDAAATATQLAYGDEEFDVAPCHGELAHSSVAAAVHRTRWLPVSGATGGVCAGRRRGSSGSRQRCRQHRT